MAAEAEAATVAATASKPVGIFCNGLATFPYPLLPTLLHCPVPPPGHIDAACWRKSPSSTSEAMAAKRRRWQRWLRWLCGGGCTARGKRDARFKGAGNGPPKTYKLNAKRSTNCFGLNWLQTQTHRRDHLSRKEIELSCAWEREIKKEKERGGEREREGARGGWETSCRKAKTRLSMMLFGYKQMG